MKVEVTSWNVSKLHGLKDKINVQPTYQRGEVWKDKKKALLVDSILRGIDIPKIYLRELERGAYKYEVADGQQRLSSIFDFIENKFSLLEIEEKGLNLNKIGNAVIGKKKFSEIHSSLQSTFRDYNISIAIIKEASNNEIRTLFGRLQEGEPLLPAEKRNAIISKVGTIIDTFSINHAFFKESRIKPERFKRQDYLSHGLALVFYNNSKPLKAALLLEMYLDKSLHCLQDFQNKVATVLDTMLLIEKESEVKIYKKFNFVDIFWFLFKNLRRIGSLNHRLFAEKFDELERRRIEVRSPQERLEEVEISVNEDLQPNDYMYDYYMAFRYAGAEPININHRQVMFSLIFNECF